MLAVAMDTMICGMKIAIIYFHRLVVLWAAGIAIIKTFSTKRILLKQFGQIRGRDKYYSSLIEIANGFF
jgi:hypothetical protein